MLYKTTIIQNGNIHYLLPEIIKLPIEPEKYVRIYWQKQYTWFRLAHILYGSVDWWWLLLKINNITNPFVEMEGKELKILKYEFLNEVRVG